MKNLILATMISFVAGAACAGELNTNGCHAAWTDATLTVGNALFTRSYVAKNGVLRTVSWARTDGAAFGDAQVIGGRGTASFDGTRLSVTIPEKLDFIWVKFAR